MEDSPIDNSTNGQNELIENSIERDCSKSTSMDALINHQRDKVLTDRNQYEKISRKYANILSTYYKNMTR